MHTPPLSASPGRHRWQDVHDWIIRQIDGDIWSEGTRLPSVRALARLFDTSLGTVQRALAALESEARVHTVPRAGILVSARAHPDDEAVDFSALTVRVDQAVVQMLSQAVQPGHLAFSSAVLADELTPHVQLKRCLATVARQYGHELHGFVPPPGLPRLRRHIAALMLARGVPCSPDDILITSGDSVAMELALTAAVPPGARIAIECPTYYGILQVIERLSMKAVPIRTDPCTGISLTQLHAAIRQGHVDAIFLNPTLHNPLGFVMPAAARQQLATLAEAAGIPVIEDDVFHDLAPADDDLTGAPGTRPAPAAGHANSAPDRTTEPHRADTASTQPRAHTTTNDRPSPTRRPPTRRPPTRTTPAIKHWLPDNTIHCASFSKTLTPGYRVGWCVPGRHRTAILAQMFSRNLSVSGLAQAVLTEFLARGYLPPHISTLRQRLADNTRFLQHLVENHFPAGTRYQPPPGGFIHWLQLPAGTHLPTLQESARQLGCPIGPSGIFYPDARPTTAIRLCLGRALTPDVARALRNLSDCAHHALTPR